MHFLIECQECIKDQENKSEKGTRCTERNERIAKDVLKEGLKVRREKGSSNGETAN